MLYLIVTLCRAPVVWGIGANKDGSNPFSLIEPKVSANLSNQFEWPVFFYVICIILIADPTINHVAYNWLAWVFVIGRLLHSIVQILTDNILLRGVIFTLNFLAVLGMWITLIGRLYV